jgi:CheY-like chemotaxis protein
MDDSEVKDTRGPVRSVLVVDDCQDTAGTTALLIRLWGYEARVALDGPTALRLAGERTPDFVLLDLAMPRMDGCQVARRLRALPGVDGMTIIAITGYGDGDHVEQARAAGCDHCLVKPVPPEALKQILESRKPQGPVGGKTP